MTSSEAMEVDQTGDQANSPPWSELPCPVVEKIYSFLDRSGRISMSLVCRNWREEYSSPSLWREMIFLFPDFEHVTGVCPDVVFARRFGAWFHRVEIICQSTPPDTPFPIEPNTAMRQLELFLEALASQSQLLSISFDVGPYMLDEDEELKDDVYRMISDFIKSQKRLKSFQMPVGFNKDEEILKALYANNYRTLRYLHIPSYHVYLSEEFDGYTVDNDLNFLVFINLEKLEMDINPMFGKMMSSFYEYRKRVDMKRRKGRLKEMRLLYRDGSPAAIHPLVWAYFRDIFPDLSVDLDLDCWSVSISFSTFIVPGMPLRSLDICLHSHPHIDNEIGSLLRHITWCNINMSLQVLAVFWNDYPPFNLAPDLINFTKVCPKLVKLELDIPHPLVDLDIVFNSWLQNRPLSLRTVNIYVSSLFDPIEEEEQIIYISLSDFYAPLLQPLELSLSIEPYE